MLEFAFFCVGKGGIGEGGVPGQWIGCVLAAIEVVEVEGTRAEEVGFVGGRVRVVVGNGGYGVAEDDEERDGKTCDGEHFCGSGEEEDIMVAREVYKILVVGAAPARYLNIS